MSHHLKHNDNDFMSIVIKDDDDDDGDKNGNDRTQMEFKI